MYPNGRQEDDQGHVTLFLKDSGHLEPANVEAHVEFSVIDREKNRRNIRRVEKEYKILNHAFGFSKFLRHAQITEDTENLLPDGNITFHCQITIQMRKCKNKNSHNPESSVSDLGLFASPLFISQMMDLIHNPQEHFSDVKIVCSDGTLDCHSSILATRSPVFKAMFSHPTKESESRTIEMTDIDKSTCYKLLTFMYTGTLRTGITEDEATSDEGLDVDINLLVAADKYNVQDLKELCEMYLNVDITLENAIPMLIIADRHSSNKLKENVKNFIVANSTELMQIPNWKKDLESHPHLMSDILEGVISSPAPAKRRKIQHIIIA